MSEKLELRPEVEAFAQLMEQRLRKNDHKPGWKKDHPLDLFSRLQEETEELRVGIWIQRSGEATADATASEAADVANFAMMIADVCGGLANKPGVTR